MPREGPSRFSTSPPRSCDPPEGAARRYPFPPLARADRSKSLSACAFAIHSGQCCALSCKINTTFLTNIPANSHCPMASTIRMGTGRRDASAAMVTRGVPPRRPAIVQPLSRTPRVGEHALSLFSDTKNVIHRNTTRNDRWLLLTFRREREERERARTQSVWSGDGIEWASRPITGRAEHRVRGTRSKRSSLMAPPRTAAGHAAERLRVGGRARGLKVD